MGGGKMLEEGNKTSRKRRCNLGDRRGATAVRHDILECLYVPQKVWCDPVRSWNCRFASLKEFVRKLDDLYLFFTTAGTGSLLVPSEFELEVCNLSLESLNFFWDA